MKEFDKNKIVDLFMDKGDLEGLEELYKHTNDNLVKIVINIYKEYNDFIGKETDINSIYDDIFNYIWEKYNLSN